VGYRAHLSTTPEDFPLLLTHRAFSPDTDIPRLLVLLAEVEAADQEGNETNEEELRLMIAWVGHDPARDRVVVEQPDNPDRLIGHALLWKLTGDTNGDVAVAVHPMWRRRGIGSRLLTWAIGRAGEVGAGNVCAYANEWHPTGGAFLHAHGFVPVAAYTMLEAPARDEWPSPVWPDGFSARTCATLDKAEQFPVMLEAINRSYAGLWGHHHVSDEAAKAWLPLVPQDGVFLAFGPDGRVAGICRAAMKIEGAQSVGMIDAPGVVSEHRDKGLYLPLMLTAARWLQQGRPASIHVESWGDAPETLMLYQGTGFRATRRETTFRLTL
jgi:mycothiol synthase